MEQIQLYTALWRESNALYAEWAKKQNLSYSELLVVLSLSEMKNGCLQKDICRQWTLPKQTVNSVLKIFMEKSLVYLVSSEADRRSKTIVLTTEGQAFCKFIAGQLQKLERAIWDKLGEKNTAALVEKTALYNKFLKEEVHGEHT